MSEKQYKKELDKLIEASNAYYSGNPIMTDEEYDKRFKKLSEYEKENNITDGILNTIEPPSKNNKVQHHTPMYSIENAFELDDIKKFLEKFPNETEFIVEPKYDGASLNITYFDGRLISVVTRGDGHIGESVRHNLKYIKNIPESINVKGFFEVRGEVVITKEHFFNYLKSKYPELSNPRNTASGSLRILDPELVKDRGLIFQPYGIGYEYGDFKTYTDVIKTLKDNGFEFPFRKDFEILGHDIKKYENHINKVLKKIREDEYEIYYDGLVIRPNHLEYNVGFTNKYPNFLLAYKFPAQEVMSKLIDVIPQVGRTGNVTPVGIIEPVEIDGVTVNRVTLHNYTEIFRKDLRLNDYIGIIRSGEVIPKLTSVFTSKRDDQTKPIEPPKECPICGTTLEFQGIYLKCINQQCNGRVVNQLIHFAKRENMNIMGLGEKMVETLVDAGALNNIKDIKTLTKDNLLKIPELSNKVKVIDKLIKEIDSKVLIPLDIFISSLGIPNVSRGIAKRIVHNLPKLNKDFKDLTIEDLKTIQDVGEVMAKSYVEYFKTNKDTVEVLLQQYQPTIKTQTIETTLNGYEFCITGKLNEDRSIWMDRIEKNGGKVVSNPKKETWILTNEIESTSSKFKKGKELGCKFVNETDLWELLNKKG